MRFYVRKLEIILHKNQTEGMPHPPCRQRSGPVVRRTVLRRRSRHCSRVRDGGCGSTTPVIADADSRPFSPEIAGSASTPGAGATTDQISGAAIGTFLAEAVEKVVRRRRRRNNGMCNLMVLKLCCRNWSIGEWMLHCSTREIVFQQPPRIYVQAEAGALFRIGSSRGPYQGRGAIPFKI